MNNKGFTLTEVLIVMIILALIIILTIPSYTSLSTSVKYSTYLSKINTIEKASLNYADNIKDDIKNNTDNNMCIDITLLTLIQSGNITADDSVNDKMINPVDNSSMDGNIKICYCPSKLELIASYYVEYDSNKEYRSGEKVIYNNKLYECIKDGAKGNIEDTTYFKLIEC